VGRLVRWLSLGDLGNWGSAGLFFAICLNGSGTAWWNYGSRLYGRFEAINHHHSAATTRPAGRERACLAQLSEMASRPPGQ